MAERGSCRKVVWEHILKTRQQPGVYDTKRRLGTNATTSFGVRLKYLASAIEWPLFHLDEIFT